MLKILLGTTEETIIVSVLAAIVLLVLIYFLVKCIHRHKLRNLFYHKYNKFLSKSERKLDINIKSKKIVIRENNRINNNDILKNINNFSIVNSNCNDLIATLGKNKQKRKKDLAFDLNALQELPKLIDVRLLEDLREPKLLQDLIVFLYKKRKKPTIDWMITSCFGNKNYFKSKNSIIYAYNGALVILKINKNKLIEPKVYNYNDLSVSIDIKVDDRIMLMCDFIFASNGEVVLNKRVRRLKIFRNKVEEISNIMMLLDSYQLYSDCASINDANKKHAHIKKMNDATLKKIEFMTGRKFISWVQLAFKSLYKTEVELKSDNQFGAYLLMQPSRSTGLTVIGVKKQIGKISTTYVNNMKQLQEKNKADEVWIITNNEFSKSSLALANNLNIRVINNNELKHIVNKYNTNYYQGF
ncbi:MAG: restriction endonuclease [Erysipelotrichales bacterium]|nr:restriction endonuclease [Erysipelotrichales bacterium]